MKKQKRYWIDEGEISWKHNGTEIAVLRSKPYIYLTDDNDEKKSQKTQKSVSKNKNLNLKIIKIELKYLEKKLDLDSFRENHKEFVKK